MSIVQYYSGTHQPDTDNLRISLALDGAWFHTTTLGVETVIKVSKEDVEEIIKQLQEVLG